ncbi:MAG: AAA family ATPase [Holophaga sp.]|nr:AAA family ATPase [Holophaga sp.]
MTRNVTINRLPTGVPGLDAVLGGGLPEFSFNLIVGQPGTGKTTLAHQLMFALATEARPALYFTVLGESPLKMLRYQQQFAFFDAARIDKAVRFVSLAGELGTGDYEKVLGRIMQEVKDHSPGLVFVDSVRSLIGGMGGSQADEFAHRLGMQLSSWQITSFLIGDFPPGGGSTSTLTVADGILALSQSVFRNSMVRKLQVQKMRGQATCPGIHSFRITDAGVEVYPSAVIPADDGSAQPTHTGPNLRRRLAMGVHVGPGALGVVAAIDR